MKLVGLVVWLFGATLTAQRTWIVDLNGGGQFTEIQPAIDAAAPGDRIEVLGAGTYAPFVLDRGVDLEAMHGAAVNAIGGGLRGNVIRDVPAGQWARVSGFMRDEGGVRLDPVPGRQLEPLARPEHAAGGGSGVARCSTAPNSISASPCGHPVGGSMTMKPFSNS
jgi:hypothetical protein